MDIMNIFEFLLVFAFGVWAGQVFMLLKFKRDLKRIVEAAGMTMDDWADTVNDLTIQAKKVPNFFTENSGNSIMLYNKDTGAFICQATSIDELATFANQYNNITVATVTHNDQELYFIEGKVKTEI